MKDENIALAERLRKAAAWIEAHGRGTIRALQDDLEKAADIIDGTAKEKEESE